MRLFSGKVPVIAGEIIRTLTAENAIEVEDVNEAQLDIESVLKEYLRQDRSITEEAKNRMEVRGLGYGSLQKIKGQIAKERRAPTGEDALPYLIDQIINILFHSHNVSEVFAEDVQLRQNITPILRRHMDVESELDEEVRSKIKNLQEGTSAFEIEYARVMEQIKRKHGLT